MMLQAFKARFLLEKNAMIFMLIVTLFLVMRVFLPTTVLSLLGYGVLLSYSFKDNRKRDKNDSKQVPMRKQFFLATRPISLRDYMASSLIMVGLFSIVLTALVFGLMMYVLKTQGAEALIRTLNQYPGNYQGIWVENPPDVSMAYAYTLMRLRILLVFGASFFFITTFVFHYQRYHFSRFQDAAVIWMYCALAFVIVILTLNFKWEPEAYLFCITVGLGCFTIYRGYRNFRKVDCI